MSIEQRKWNDILAVGYMDDKILQHLEEDDPNTTTSRSSSRKRCSDGMEKIVCDLQGRRMNFTNSKTLVGWSVSRPTVTRVASDLPERKELF